LLFVESVHLVTLCISNVVIVINVAVISGRITQGGKRRWAL
jgi:hypothetical protein